MNEKDFQLYQEEQREQLITLNKGIESLKNILSGDLAVLVKNEISKQEITGSVEVSNQLDNINIKNLSEVIDSLDSLKTEVTKSIQDNKVEISEITVKNIKDAQQDVVSIKNLSELKTYFDDLAETVKSNQPIINIEKQVVEFPTSPKKPIAVRLSDGKSFYNALSIAMGSAFNASGLSTSAKQDEIITAIQAIGGSTNYTTRIEEDSGDSNVTYVGKAVSGSATSSAVWQIQKIDETTGMVITWGGTGAFDQEWDERAGTVVYA